jgi:hypothetical protein
VAWSAATVHAPDTHNVVLTPAFTTWVAAVQAVDPSLQVARGSHHVVWSSVGVHVSFVVQYAELASNLSAWVAAVHAALSQVFLWSQHVVWSFAGVHVSYEVHNSELTSTFRRSVAAVHEL